MTALERARETLDQLVYGARLSYDEQAALRLLLDATRVVARVPDGEHTWVYAEGVGFICARCPAACDDDVPCLSHLACRTGGRSV